MLTKTVDESNSDSMNSHGRLAACKADLFFVNLCSK